MVADWYQYLLFPIASVQYDSSAGMRKRRGIYKILYIQIEWIYFKNKRDIFLVSAMVTEVIYTVTTTEAAVTAGCVCATGPQSCSLLQDEGKGCEAESRRDFASSTEHKAHHCFTGIAHDQSMKWNSEKDSFILYSIKSFVFLLPSAPICC